MLDDQSLRSLAWGRLEHANQPQPVTQAFLDGLQAPGVTDEVARELIEKFGAKDCTTEDGEQDLWIPFTLAARKRKASDVDVDETGEDESHEDDLASPSAPLGRTRRSIHRVSKSEEDDLYSARDDWEIWHSVWRGIASGYEIWSMEYAGNNFDFQVGFGRWRTWVPKRQFNAISAFYLPTDNTSTTISRISQAHVRSLCFQCSPQSSLTSFLPNTLAATISIFIQLIFHSTFICTGRRIQAVKRF